MNEPTSLTYSNNRDGQSQRTLPIILSSHSTYSVSQPSFILLQVGCTNCFR